ncbi:GNAT family N-acetyltransferase [Rhizobium leguminosarum]|uniref:GNAT family N-acetyltransferase n=1 Tax=Rhizobium leguminosarum TaxID=384 RepID=UPI001A0A8ACC|nr:GNAT family N-acetyltransferase [Rhizobium leguminosarum]NKK80931.1 GNAT family N-acetyltransferase [Rhizobium leguminosarum bv. viciae]NKL05832.1 GNAT family N-acetyltransferase [Rhizobium leguminosarum bv. viciae]NKM07609.1 GNAT family N-acetyltransferase [Rhizobium leguminosarum bv. viciae]NKM78672.1 GNAT family N-acetyltransferase [Rhizobium leguminosarum bv. viciae]
MDELMQTESVVLAPFEAHHLDGAVALSRAAGWAHRKEDWEMIWSLSQGRVALAGDRVVGTALMTPFGDTCSAINMIIVDESQRGRGLGRQLTTAVLELAGNRECRLTATNDGLPLYEKLGFVATDQIVRHQGIVSRVNAPQNVEWVEPDALPEIKAVDGAAFGASRDTLIDVLSKEGRFSAIRNDDRIVAFASTRLFGKGEVVGPVVAENVEQARDLLAFILSGKEGRFVRIDIPEQTGLSSQLEDWGMPQEGEVVAMVRGAAGGSQTPAVQTFCLASQAIG